MIDCCFFVLFAESERKERGFDFVLDACGSSTFLEDLTGLTAMKNEQVQWDVEPVSGEDEAVDDFSMD